MHELLVEPFQAEFMRTGLAAAVIVGVLCAVVGSFVVVRGMALLADSFAHGVIPGVAVGVLVSAGTGGGDPDRLAVLVGGLLGGVVTAAGTTLILRRTRFQADTATAVMFVFMLALGVVLISRASDYAVDLTAFLFGDVLGVEPSELLLTGALTLAVLAAVALLYRHLVLVAFDPRRAAAMGVPVTRTELAQMLLVAIAVVVGFRVVGALLVLGLLIALPAAAALVTRRLPTMMLVASALAVLAAPIGLLASWHLDVAAGAAIVLAAVALFAVVLVARPARA